MFKELLFFSYQFTKSQQLCIIFNRTKMTLKLKQIFHNQIKIKNNNNNNNKNLNYNNNNKCLKKEKRKVIKNPKL